MDFTVQNFEITTTAEITVTPIFKNLDLFAMDLVKLSI